MTIKTVILVSVYNGSHWINKQIESILRNSNIKAYIFVSVDPSTDNTESLCNQLAEQDSRITVLPNIGTFGGAAPNFFRLLRDVNFSDVDYIAFADQDDIWHSDKLSRAIQMLAEHACDGYSSNVTAFWPDGHEVLVDKAQPQVEWDYLFESAGPGCTFVMTQKLALELQAFVHTNKEAMLSIWLHDWFTYAFARSHGYKWYIDKYPSMLYRQHENNQVGVNTGYKALLHRIRYVLSGKALEQSFLIATLCGLDNHPFVKKWHDFSRLGMLRLALSATKCRRKPSEKVIFAFTCLILFFTGHKKP